MLSQEINKAIIYSISMNYHLIFFLLKKKKRKEKDTEHEGGSQTKDICMYMCMHALYIQYICMHVCVRVGARVDEYLCTGRYSCTHRHKYTHTRTQNILWSSLCKWACTHVLCVFECKLSVWVSESKWVNECEWVTRWVLLCKCVYVCMWVTAYVERVCV